MQSFDIVIIGGGVAGFSLSLQLVSAFRLQTAGKNPRIALMTKSDLTETSSYWAQGGIAASASCTERPSFFDQACVDQACTNTLTEATSSHLDAMAHFADTESHVTDTIRAGAGLCDAYAAQTIIRQSHAVIRWLIDLGVPFTRWSDFKTRDTDACHPAHQHADAYHLVQEGGHSQRRIFHVADTTGAFLSATLLQQVQQENIHVFTNMVALDLILHQSASGTTACAGVYAYQQQKQCIQALVAPVTVLATGGASSVYLHSTNPQQNNGDGMAMALRAGCDLVNMEFQQFHPTCLYTPQQGQDPYPKAAKNRPLLISEALRGEGARLVHADGQNFMSRYHQAAELAPRDIVTRAINTEIRRAGVDHLYLDIRFKDKDFILSHFPMLYHRCREQGVDMCKDLIPIVPAAHYTCGGIATNLYGHTARKGLYALGECAHTGLHGANRLASNSLLECLVLALRASQAIVYDWMHLSSQKSSQSPSPSRVDAAAYQHIKIQTDHWNRQAGNFARVPDLQSETDTLHRLMWDHVGILRHSARLTEALVSIDDLYQRTEKRLHPQEKMHPDYFIWRNLFITARAMICAALQRKESRGTHYNTDYPAYHKEALFSRVSRLHYKDLLI